MITIASPPNQAQNGAGGPPQNGQPAAADQPPPPPAYPSQAAVVCVTLPTKDGGGGNQGLGGLGMGMSIGGRRGKDSDTTNGASGDGKGDRDANNLSSGHNHANGGTAAVPIGNGNSPVSKRKPLTSSFSMLGGLSLAAGGDNSHGGVATSRPARTFKGSTSSFIRSWEGMPISQVQLRTIGEANAGRQTVFGFQTLGKVLLWHEIGMGKKVSPSLRKRGQRICGPSRLTCTLPISLSAGSPQPNCLRVLPDLHRRESAYRDRFADRRTCRLRHRRYPLDR